MGMQIAAAGERTTNRGEIHILALVKEPGNSCVCFSARIGR